MQPNGYLSGETLKEAHRRWLDARNQAVAAACHVAFGARLGEQVYRLCEDGTWDAVKHYAPGVSKELVNRLLEPFMWTQVVATGNIEAWQGFVALRGHSDAQIDMQDLAVAVDCLVRNTQDMQELYPGQWHLPYIELPENVANTPYLDPEWALASASACARVSYLRQGTPLETDKARALMQSGHLSPFEHVAQATVDFPTTGNVTGFVQVRQYIEQHHIR